MTFNFRDNWLNILRTLILLVLLLSARQLVSGTWITKTPMPTARANPGSAVVNDTIYVIGGSDSGIYYSVNEVYDPSTDNWSTKDSLPVDAVFCRAVALDNKIYVVGLEHYSGPAFLQEYDPATDTWIAKTPMNILRHSYAVGTSQGKIYVIGGETSPGNIYLPDNEEYNPTTDTWTTKTPMPTARARLAMGVWHDTLYCVGGNDSDSTYSKNEVYDPVTDSWTTKADMLTSRKSLGAATIEDTIYFVGGDLIGAYQANEGYIATTDTWFSDTPMPSKRGFLAVESVNDKFYAIGGLYSFNYLDTNEEFAPSVGIEESQIPSFDCPIQILEAYPNPFTDRINIAYSIGHPDGIVDAFHRTSNAEGIELKIYDVSGRLVKSVPLTTNHLSLGTDLSPGIYFLKANGKNIGKVVKVR